MKIFEDSPTLGKFNHDAAASISRSFDAKHEELNAAYARIDELVCTLQECREYFEERADSDFSTEASSANIEMTMLVSIDEVLL